MRGHGYANPIPYVGGKSAKSSAPSTAINLGPVVLIAAIEPASKYTSVDLPENDGVITI